MLARIFFISCFLLCQTVIINAEPFGDWLLALADVADAILNLIDSKLALKEQTFKSTRELLQTALTGIPPLPNIRSGPRVQLKLPKMADGEEKGLRSFSLGRGQMEGDIKSPVLSKIAEVLGLKTISNTSQEKS